MSSYKFSDKYKCSQCDAKNIKLWRVSHSSCIDLVCYNCSKEKRAIDGEGYIIDEYAQKTDQIKGGLVPAVPIFDSDVEAYWGYSSVPPKGVSWWRALSSK